MKKRKGLKWFVVAALVMAGAYTVWRWNHAEEKSPAYESVPVTRSNIVLTIKSTGTVRPQNRLEIKPSVPGRVDEVLVDEGDNVKEGQVVAWMSSTDRAALLDAARARGPAELAKWKEVYKAIALIAPLDGFIISRDMEPGQSVTAQNAILVMADKLVIEAQVDETDLAQIRLNQPVMVTLDAYPQQLFPARVSHIAYEAKTVDNVTIYHADVLPEKMPPFVRSGMTANVVFHGAAVSNVPMLPAEAVMEEADGTYVRTPSERHPEKTRRVKIQTGLTDGKIIEIKSGLKEGDTVLIPQMSKAGSKAAATNPFMPFGNKRTNDDRRTMRKAL